MVKLGLVTGMLAAMTAGKQIWPAAAAHAQQPTLVTWQEISSLAMPPADHRIQYGPDPLQFGDLRLPQQPGPHPVVVVVHGGCWRAENDLQHVSHLSAALTTAGFATWTIEYRRIGNPGGGWPGTFEDAVRGAEYVSRLARDHHLDAERVLLLGHSLLGGTAADVPERYALASPIELLPLRVPHRLLHGSLDPHVPLEQGQTFARRAREHGDDVEVLVIEGAGHFDLIAPFSTFQEAVIRTAHGLLARR